MTIVLVGLGGIWVGGSLGLVVGGLLANSKSRDLEAAYQRLSLAIHEYLEECARKSLREPETPSQLIVLRRVVAESDVLAGFDQSEVPHEGASSNCPNAVLDALPQHESTSTSSSSAD